MMHTHASQPMVIKKINEATFKGSLMFSKIIVKFFYNARKITEEDGFGEDDCCRTPNAVGDSAVHRVIIFLVEALQMSICRILLLIFYQLLTHVYTKKIEGKL